ncbi:hypothetical protein KY285_007580 [Solanum tuberosum]|nr:hypothetical protein KY285_007580 [Solanum tuberosum]
MNQTQSERSESLPPKDEHELWLEFEGDSCWRRSVSSMGIFLHWSEGRLTVAGSAMAIPVELST